MESNYPEEGFLTIFLVVITIAASIFLVFI